MADPHFMYSQQHQAIDPKQTRKESTTKSWVKRAASVMVLVAAVGITAYSFAGTEAPVGAVSIDASQTAKGAIVVVGTNTGNVWVNKVSCADKLSAVGCGGDSWLNLGGDLKNPSIAFRAGSTNKFHIVALGKDDKAYFTDIDCITNCVVSGAKSSPDAWQLVPGQTFSASQVVALTPLSPPLNADCEATLLLEKGGKGRAYEAATCSNGANSGELKPVSLRKNTDAIDTENAAGKDIVSIYTNDSFGRKVYLQTKESIVSQLSEVGYNDQPTVSEESVINIKSLKQSSHSFTMHGSAGITSIRSYGIKPDGSVYMFSAKTDGTLTTNRIFSTITDQKDIYTGTDGFILKDAKNHYAFVFPLNPTKANTAGTAVDLGGSYPVGTVIDTKIFAIDDTGVVRYRTYAAQKDAVGTVTGIDTTKSQDWKAL